MANDTLTIKYQDINGATGTFQMPVLAGLGPAHADIVDMVQQAQDASHAQVIEVTLTQAVALPTSNPAPSPDPGNDTVEDQAAFQARRTDGGGYTRFSIPAPRDLLFEPTGAFANADVKDDEATLVEPLLDAAALVWRAPAGLTVTYDKGWRKGRKHS